MEEGCSEARLGPVADDVSVGDGADGLWFYRVFPWESQQLGLFAARVETILAGRPLAR